MAAGQRLARPPQRGRMVQIGEGALPVRHSLVHPDDFLPQGRRRIPARRESVATPQGVE